MFYAALLMFGTVFYATILRLRRRLWTSLRFHRFVMWTTTAGIIAILGGWVTAQTGRQPWVVFGYLRTSAAVSHLAPGEVLFSVIGFCLLHTLLGVSLWAGFPLAFGTILPHAYLGFPEQRRNFR